MSMSASGFSTSRMMRLPALIVSGAPVAIDFTYSSRSAGSSAGSVMRFTRPMRCASAASSRRAVKKMSFAWPGPTRSVRFFIAEKR